MVSMQNKFWRGKRVLITGYEGFLGSHLTRALLKNRAKVCGLDIKTHRQDTVLSNNELDSMKVIKGSVKNLSLLGDVIKREKIEFVFHLAATSLVGEALQKPLEAFSTNIEGTWNILEACRHAKSLEGIIVASSDKAYGCHDKLPYLENYPLAGAHPYDVSKSCADLLAHTYFKTYNLPVCITRCGNIYGPGDFNFSRIVPDTVGSIVKNKTLLIRSDGKFTRDYIFIEDIITAYMLLAQKMAKLNLQGEAFNFSDEDPVSVLELVKKIYRLAGKKEDFKILNRAKFEIKHQYLSSGKARRLLGWEPKFRLEAGLSSTICWYRELLERIGFNSRGSL